MTGELYTIPFSHYCELARWSLQEAKVSFVEYPYLPGVHTFFGPMERIRKRRSGGESTGKGQGTPLYLTSDGQILDDSWQILSLTGLTGLPVSEDMKALLNYQIGPQVRSIVYADLLRPEKDADFAAMGQGCPVSWWQRGLWSLGGFRRKVSSVMKQQMVGDEERQAKTLKDFEEAIEKVEAELSKPDGCFQGAPNELTASALALAALFAPAVCPAEYTGGFVPEIKPETFSEAHQERIRQWRQRPIGQFTLELYRRHRMRCVSRS
ncbi:2-mannosyltransferase-like 4 [Durusdinium trenchii]|uniref:2-mannosyltransferase-like 4 n=1 Tax=Durusdinium trenchii TaxID=1381693 RepID=A0ABP0M1X4_9DINO